MIRKDNIDIAIIGAGPAGCSTSMFLSKKGISHSLFEKEAFPRDKICGDGLSGKVMGYLNKLDSRLVGKIAADTQHFLPSWGARFVAPNGTVIDIPHISENGSSGPPGYVSRRIDFDKFLSDNLNPDYCYLNTNAVVKKIDIHSDGVVLNVHQNGEEILYKAKMVIDAGGDHSLLGRQAQKGKSQPQHIYAGLRQYYKNVSGCHEGNYIEMHFLQETLPGYFWIFPLAGNEANVGVGMLSNDIRSNNINLRKLLNEAIKKNPALIKRFENAEPLEDARGWRLPLGSAGKPLSGERYLLTGDAGSLVDPFTGEGIGNAMLSGSVAAEVIAEGMAKNDFSATFLKQYDRCIKERLGSEFRLSASIQKLARKTWLFNFVVNRIYRSPELQRMFSEMFDNFSLRDRLRSPSFYVRLLFNK